MISSDHTNCGLSWSCFVTCSFSLVLKIVVELETLQLDASLKFIYVFHNASQSECLTRVSYCEQSTSSCSVSSVVPSVNWKWGWVCGVGCF